MARKASGREQLELAMERLKKAKTAAELRAAQPIGIRMSDVKAFCVSKNLICSFSDTAGYWDRYAAKAIGVKSIWTVLSDYRTTPLTTTAVTVYWGFDDEERLVDVLVWKTIDAP